MTVTPIRLEGNAIRLEPLAPAHVPELCAVGLDPRLWRTTTIQVGTKVEMEAYVRAAIDAQIAGTALPFVIIEASTGTIVGTTRYHSITPAHRRLEIGFTWIAIPWQRTIVNTEAKYLLLRHAFEILGCIRVEFKADAENEQSRRALSRIGAKQEGILRNYRLSALRGPRDLAVFSIIAGEWTHVRADLEAKLGKGPNQSVQPTPGIVTPRAFSSKTECPNRTGQFSVARAAPIPSVADL